MLTSKKGMSALQIMRTMGFGSVKTAHSMCHKIRAALIEPETKLGGIVEVDETFVGGKAKTNRHGKRTARWARASGKAIVVGAVRRKGNVVARVIENVSAITLEAFVNEAVSDKVSLLCTDQWVGYKHLANRIPARNRSPSHKSSTLSARSTPTRLRASGRIFKRGIVGTFHKVSKKYLQLYVAEFQFRYNNRFNDDIFGTAIEGALSFPVLAASSVGINSPVFPPHRINPPTISAAQKTRRLLLKC